MQRIELAKIKIIGGSQIDLNIGPSFITQLSQLWDETSRHLDLEDGWLSQSALAQVPHLSLMTPTLKEKRTTKTQSLNLPPALRTSLKHEIGPLQPYT